MLISFIFKKIYEESTTNHTNQHEQIKVRAVRAYPAPKNLGAG
jgi:hypothetical protein